MGDETFTYDCFISYRRSDGTPTAQWLRDRLVRYRLPRELNGSERGSLNVYLDTAYERATQDFFDENIAPALRQSRFLIVVATPAANEKLPGDEPNWVEREIGVFLATPQKDNILAVRGVGKWDDPLPANLQTLFPRLHIVDARGATNSLLRKALDWMVVPAEISTLAAPLFGITQDKMPLLRREEATRARVRVFSTVAVGVTIAITIAALGGYGWYQKVQTDAANQLVLSRFLAWQAGVIGEGAPRRLDEALLLAIEAYRRGAAPITAAALHDRLDPTPLPIARLKHDTQANLAKFTADGKYLVTASEQGMHVWDYSNGRVLARLDRGKPVRQFEFGPGDGEITAIFRTPTRRTSAKDQKVEPGEVVTWHWADNVIKAVYSPSEPIRRLIVDPEVRLVAGATSAGIWRAAEDRVVPLAGFKRGRSFALDVSGDARYMAIGGVHGVDVFDTRTGERLRSIAEPDQPRVTEIGFSRDGSRLLIGHDDGKTGMWDWRAGAKAFDHAGYSDPSAFAFSPDGAVVAEIDFSASASLRIWNSSDGANVWGMESAGPPQSGEYFVAATISPDSKWLAADLADGALRVVRIDGENSALALKFTTNALIRSVAFHPDGRRIAAADGAGFVTVWQLDRSRAATDFQGAVDFEIGTAIADRTALVGPVLRIVDRNLKLVTERPIDAKDSKLARLSGSGRRIALTQQDGKLLVLDLAASDNGRSHDPPQDSPAMASPKEDAEDARNDIIDLRFSDDEQNLIVVRRKGIAELDLATWRETLRISKAIPPYVAFSSDGSLLATKEVNGPITIYNIRTLDEWLIPARAFDTSIGFSPNGRFFAGRAPSTNPSPDKDSETEGMMTVWDVVTRQPLMSVPVASNTSEIAFDAASDYFAFSEMEKIHVWRLSSRKQMELVQRGNEVSALAFHPKEPLLAAGYSDKRIRVWKLAPDPAVLTEIPQDDEFTFGSRPMKFTPDGRYLVRAQGSADDGFGAFVSFFPWRQEDLLAHACARTLDKKLATAVWAEYLPGEAYRATCPEPPPP